MDALFSFAIVAFIAICLLAWLELRNARGRLDAWRVRLDGLEREHASLRTAVRLARERGHRGAR